MGAFARSICGDVEFSAEDAVRSDLEFLFQVFKRAIAAGETTLNRKFKYSMYYRAYLTG